MIIFRNLVRSSTLSSLVRISAGRSFELIGCMEVSFVVSTQLWNWCSMLFRCLVIGWYLLMWAISRAPELSSTTLQCTFALSVLISSLYRICHTAGRIVAPSRTLSLFMIKELPFSYLSSHYFCIAFLNSSVYYFSMDWYICIVSEPKVALNPISESAYTSWSSGNMYLRQRASPCMWMIVAVSNLCCIVYLHFVINVCLGLQIRVDLLCFRMLLTSFFCWKPSISFIWEAYYWLPIYLAFRYFLLIWNWCWFQHWVCPLC